MIDWNCGGLKRPESRRNSSSVRMVLQERLAAAGSMPMMKRLLGKEVKMLWSISVFCSMRLIEAFVHCGERGIQDGSLVSLIEG